MNVLIVDDQVPVVEGILSGVKWDDIGVETVCGAFSMQGAQEQFNYHSFDVAVCDIKMPFGSGVELVEWIKENYPKTETIFLTSHAEFEYAQKAVKLGCFDYLIQPVAYDELQDCIEKALKKVALGEEEGQLKAYGSAYRESREELQKSFWRDVIYNERSADAENVAVAAKRVGIDLKDDEDYLPVYLVFHERNINLEEIDKVTRAKDAFIEALPYIGIHAEYKLAELEKNALFLMLELWNDIEYERLVSQMKLFVNVSKVQLGYAWE